MDVDSELAVGRGDPPSRAWPISAMSLAAAGLLASVWIFASAQVTGDVVGCPITGWIDCGRVTNSPWSRIAGVPLPFIGTAYFLAMAWLCRPRTWARPGWIATTRVVGAIAGVLFVVWLVWVEFALVHALCLWCTAVHLITLALAFVIVIDQAR